MNKIRLFEPSEGLNNRIASTFYACFKIKATCCKENSIYLNNYFNMLIRWSAIACLASIVLCFQSCKSDPAVTYQQLEGKTMGTTYHITYFGASDYQAAIDSLLKVINQEVSTYIPNSTISQFNQADSSYDLGLAAQDTAHPEYVTRKHFIINF
ncbi:MAG: hypothetical protein HC892_16620 [Saprospiraceae bacterium]|nr:hypothetical protein [Saprospiraceae bacterium]